MLADVTVQDDKSLRSYRSERGEKDDRKKES